MNERAIVEKIQKYLKEQGCFVIKTADKFTSGIPDLIVLTNQGVVVFIEVKTPEGKLERIQEYMIEKIKLQGCYAFIARSVADVKRILDEVKVFSLTK